MYPRAPASSQEYQSLLRCGKKLVRGPQVFHHVKIGPNAGLFIHGDSLCRHLAFELGEVEEYVQGYLPRDGPVHSISNLAREGDRCVDFPEASLVGKISQYEISSTLLKISSRCVFPRLAFGSTGGVVDVGSRS